MVDVGKSKYSEPSSQLEHRHGRHQQQPVSTDLVNQGGRGT